MKLERSTYVKIALIVLLCLGVCGFFGGCRGIVPWGGSLLAPGGLMGCVGWNAMGEIAGYAGDAVGEMAGYAGDAASEVADATLHSGVRGGVASTSEGSRNRRQRGKRHRSELARRVGLRARGAR